MNWQETRNLTQEQINKKYGNGITARMNGNAVRPRISRSRWMFRRIVGLIKNPMSIINDRHHKLNRTRGYITGLAGKKNQHTNKGNDNNANHWKTREDSLAKQELLELFNRKAPVNKTSDDRYWGRSEITKAPEPIIEPEPVEEKKIEVLPDLRLGDLNNLIGLESVKMQVRQLASFIAIQKLKKKHHMKATIPNLHIVFTGNPGTGKTTVAKIIGEIYKKIGLLESGHVVIVKPRVDMIGEYIGQTGPKTEACIKRAMGGVLFIDEAYSLIHKESPRDFGPDAIAVLLDYMESKRKEFVVIMAGYSGDMNFLLSSNPGLKSRFSNIINFPDYSIDDLISIFDRMAGENEYFMQDGVLEKVKNYLEQEKEHEKLDFGNARSVRNLLEKMEINQASRIEKIINDLPVDELKNVLRTYLPEDVNDIYIKTGEDFRNKIGF